MKLKTSDEDVILWTQIALSRITSAIQDLQLSGVCKEDIIGIYLSRRDFFSSDPEGDNMYKMLYHIVENFEICGEKVWK